MQNSGTRFILPLLFLFSIISLAGCTAIGFLSGLAIDSNSKSEQDTLAVSDIISLRKGEEISVLPNRTTDPTVYGKFDTLEQLSDSSYKEHYGSAILVHTKLLPALGETLLVYN